MRRCFFLLSAMVLLLLSNPAHAQSLEKSVSFILSAGRMELSDIKQIDPDTVITEATDGRGDIFKKLKVTDRKQCIFRAFNDGDSIYAQYNLENVILAETEITPAGRDVLGHQMATINLRGENDVLCKNKGFLSGCSKALSILVDNVDRVTKAIKYVYANFCASATRKSAF